MYSTAADAMIVDLPLPYRSSLSPACVFQVFRHLPKSLKRDIEKEIDVQFVTKIPLYEIFHSILL